MQHALTYSI